MQPHERGQRDPDFKPKGFYPAQNPWILKPSRAILLRILGCSSLAPQNDWTGFLAGFLPAPDPTRPYLHNFLCYLSCLVDIQDNFGVPHHGVESPSFAQAGRTGKGREKLQTLLQKQPQIVNRELWIITGFWPGFGLLARGRSTIPQGTGGSPSLALGGSSCCSWRVLVASLWWHKGQPGLAPGFSLCPSPEQTTWSSCL